MQKDCIFCKIVQGEIPSKKVFENEKLIVIEDVNPQAPVHLLIIPKEHIATVLDLSEKHKELIGSILLTAAQIAKEKKIAEPGFRTVVNCNRGAGQTVFHIHFHLLGGRDFGWPPG